ncbi:hypothetical protein OH76DRAFT_1497308 [Lentinus brumalis]|uniref:Uncharacterized protein n=1 Tax=Lentinus brumalis TaxID=2498619 RepID=A0A371DJT6_9APHY|nr:hypothetical protein OH76DRAFT_1497308 [Polyporus brumalis]
MNSNLQQHDAAWDRFSSHWNQLAKKNDENYPNANLDVRRETAPGVVSAWALNDWESMNDYITTLRLHSADQQFYQAISAVFPANDGQIQKLRNRRDPEPALLVGVVQSPSPTQSTYPPMTPETDTPVIRTSEVNGAVEERRERFCRSSPFHSPVGYRIPDHISTTGSTSPAGSTLGMVNGGAYEPRRISSSPMSVSGASTETASMTTVGPKVAQQQTRTNRRRQRCKICRNSTANHTLSNQTVTRRMMPFLALSSSNLGSGGETPYRNNNSVELPSQITRGDFRLKDLELLGWTKTQALELPHLSPTDVTTQVKIMAEHAEWISSSICITCAFTPGSVSLSSLEKRLRSGRIRISLLFIPIETKLPPKLLGLDTETLEIRDISVQSREVDLSKCDVRLKLTTGEAEDYWDTDKEKVEPIGSVFPDLVFWPRIAKKHYELLNGQGFHDAIGELAVKVPQYHQLQESHDTQERDEAQPSREQTDKTMTNGPMNITFHHDPVSVGRATACQHTTPAYAFGIAFTTDLMGLRFGPSMLLFAVSDTHRGSRNDRAIPPGGLQVTKSVVAPDRCDVVREDREDAVAEERAAFTVTAAFQVSGDATFKFKAFQASISWNCSVTITPTRIPQKRLEPIARPYVAWPFPYNPTFIRDPTTGPVSAREVEWLRMMSRGRYLGCPDIVRNK